MKQQHVDQPGSPDQPASKPADSDGQARRFPSPGSRGPAIDIYIAVILAAALWGTLLCFGWRISLMIVGL